MTRYDRSESRDAESPLVGREIVAVRHLSDAELEQNGRENPHMAVPVAVILNDGTKLFAATDEARAAPGHLHGERPNGDPLTEQDFVADS